MNMASGVEEWGPEFTGHILQARETCELTLITPIDCGNGVCCPLGSSCVKAADGNTNCEGGASGLGTAVVPGLTISTAAQTVSTVPSTSVTSSTQSVSVSVEIQTVTASPPPSSSSSASSSESSSESSSVSSSVSSSASPSASSTETAPSPEETQLTTSLSSIAATSSIRGGATTAATTTAKAVNMGGATPAVGTISTDSSNTPLIGKLNSPAVAGIILGVGVIGVAIGIAILLLCVRLQQRKKAANAKAANAKPPSEDGTERDTVTLPRGAEKSFDDVVAARRRDDESIRRDDGESVRRYDEDSRRRYDEDSRRRYDEESRRRHDEESTRGYDEESLRRTSAWGSTARTSQLQNPFEPEIRMIRDAYAGSTHSRDEEPSEPLGANWGSLRRLSIPAVRSRDSRDLTARSPRNDYYSELELPEPAATFLRDPFSTPEPKSPRRSISPKRYLYPETDRESEPAEGKSEKKQESEESDDEGRRPLNYLPVFQAPVFAVLPGKSGAIVEMI